MKFVQHTLSLILLTSVSLLILSFIIFSCVYLLGDPIDLLMGANLVALDRAQAAQALGLDGTLITQYMHFMHGLVSGHVAQSYIYQRPALDLITERLPASLELAIAALVIASYMGTQLGLYSLKHKDSPTSRLIQNYALLSQSFPLYFFALLLVSLFAVKLGWLPALGRGETMTMFGMSFSFLTLDGLTHMILPLMTLCFMKTGLFVRYATQFGGVVESAAATHFAEARGLTRNTIYNRHILKNILVPLSSLVVLEFGGILVSAVITETIFAWPGIGKLLIDAILYADRPVLIVFILYVAVFYAIMNILVDIFHRLIDPRLRTARHDV